MKDIEEWYNIFDEFSACCGSCAFFKNGTVCGDGLCVISGDITDCSDHCGNYESL